MPRPVSPRRTRSHAAGTEESNAGFTPKRKTVQLNPVVGIALFSSPLVLLLFIAVMYFNQEQSTPPSPGETDDNFRYQQIAGEIPKAKESYQRAMRMRESDDQVAFNAEVDKAIEEINGLLFRFDDILGPVRDPETEDLAPGYGEYDRDYQKLQRWLHDLMKTRGL